MYPESRWSLIALGAAMAISGLMLIVMRRRTPDGEKASPYDDSFGGRLIGGFVMIAFGVVVGLVGFDLMSTGR